jgi:very-short-patch-repair endonuclease
MTPAETAMWRVLRGRGFEHYKFRRQTRIGPWVADFCCYELRLVVELDGGVHRLREAEDAARDADLLRRGFTVLRFGNEAVLANPNLLLDAVRRHAVQRPPHPSGSA